MHKINLTYKPEEEFSLSIPVNDVTAPLFPPRYLQAKLLRKDKEILSWRIDYSLNGRGIFSQYNLDKFERNLPRNIRKQFPGLPQAIVEGLEKTADRLGIKLIYQVLG